MIIIKYVTVPIIAIILLFSLLRFIIFLEISTKKNRKIIKTLSLNIFSKITGLYIIKNNLIENYIIKIFIILLVILLNLIIFTLLSYITYLTTKKLFLLEINLIIIRVILGISLLLLFINAIISKKQTKK